MAKREKKNMSNGNNVIGFGQFFISKNMPCVEIRYYDEELAELYREEGKYQPDEEGYNRRAYLYCFRDYAIQLCGSITGENDLGSTPVFGLDTFASIEQMGRSNLQQKTTVLYFISCIVRDALSQFIHSAYGEGLELPRHAVTPYSFGYNENYGLFLEAIYTKYVQKLSSFEKDEDWVNYCFDKKEAV